MRHEKPKASLADERRAFGDSCAIRVVPLLLWLFHSSPEIAPQPPYLYLWLTEFLDVNSAVQAAIHKMLQNLICGSDVTRPVR